MQLKTIILLISGFVCLIIIGGLTMSYTEKLGLTLPTDADRVNRAAHIQMLEEIDEKVQSDLGIMSIKRFGAVGDGVTNDTQAFLDALDFLRSNNGGNLYIPKGIYMINQTLKIPSNVTIQGAGIDKAIIKAIPDTLFPYVKFHPAMLDNRDYRSLITTDSVGGEGVTTNIKISGLTIDWSNCPGSDRSTSPLWIDSAKYVIIEEVKVINALPSDQPVNPHELVGIYDYRSEGIQTTQSQYVIINKCHLSTAGYRCMSIGAGSFDVTFSKNTIEAANPWRHQLECWEWEPANLLTERIKIIDNTFRMIGGGMQDFISVHGAGKIIIANNTFKIVTPSSIFSQCIKIFDGAYDVNVNNNILNLDTGISDYCSAIALETHELNVFPAPTKNITITSNQIYLKVNDGTYARSYGRNPVIGGTLDIHKNIVVANNNITLDIPTGKTVQAIRIKATNASIANNVINFLGTQSGVEEGPAGVAVISSNCVTVNGNTVIGAYDYGGFIVASEEVVVTGNNFADALRDPLLSRENTNIKIAHNIGVVTHNE